MSGESNQSFFIKCVDRFHDTLNEICGKSDIVSIPELFAFGTQAIAGYVSDGNIERKFGIDRRGYMSALVSLCVQTGITHASMYRKEARSIAKNAALVNAGNLGFFCSMVLSSEMRTSAARANAVCARIFDDWSALTGKDWTPQEHAQEIFDSFMAAYQFGISWYMAESEAE